ncbi:hypothetical protein GDO86_009130 [Hymenochirus boettgeri]|uniref:Delta(14)-sterol reductase LBR n=1 Tax=Hymenochirus boettgeri TaxID=247094 RepID=A0A8T2JJU5_9PIPI|nr:hypothetical protein GDO86_009130 [Hymenochirus boettgeri]
MPSQRYNVGDSVMGRWPGSSLYYEVQVMDFHVPTQHYKVRYKDGTELELKENDIRSITSFRNKKRSTSPSRRRSRSRSRSPGRSRSPSRIIKNGHQSPLIRDVRKVDRLQVHLTQLKPQDYVIGKQNGEPDGYEKNTSHLTPVKTKPEEQIEKGEKVLRYSMTPRRDHFMPKDVVPTESAPAENVQEIKEAIKDCRETNGEIQRPETGGAFVSLLMTLCTPLLLFYLLILIGQLEIPNSPFVFLWDKGIFGFFVLWILLQVMLHLFPMGKAVDGVKLENGRTLKYRINGFTALLLTVLTVAVMTCYSEITPIYIFEHHLQFAASATIVSVILSVYLYLRSRSIPNEALSEAGKAGNVVTKFYMGQELNPRIGQLDLKLFCAHRLGFIGWGLVNFALLLAEMEIQQREVPSLSMILVNSFQFIYILHALWNEESRLTSPDIVHDGFGFEQAFRHLVWVPFTYSLQALYLVNNPVDMTWKEVSAIVALKALGFIIFQGANKQKFSFRKNPDDSNLSHLKTIPTGTGSKLLVSGWWGFVRHPNYLGDMIMALSWCLPCGFSHIAPYFYMISLTIYLIHRQAINERKCRNNYGPAWDQYCQSVRYRIFPYIY